MDRAFVSRTSSSHTFSRGLYFLFVNVFSYLFFLDAVKTYEFTWAIRSASERSIKKKDQNASV